MYVRLSAPFVHVPESLTPTVPSAPIAPWPFNTNAQSAVDTQPPLTATNGANPVTDIGVDEAEKLIKRALVIEPDDGFYVDSLGWVYYQQGDYSRAVAELERAVNLTGNDPTITEHLGDAYRKLGKLRDARHQYEDALVKAQAADQVQRLKNKLNGLGDTEQHASH